MDPLLAGCSTWAVASPGLTTCACAHGHAGRIGVAQDMVGPALFLASHASDYVTGAELLVDGGGAALPMLANQDPDAYKA